MDDDAALKDFFYPTYSDACNNLKYNQNCIGLWLIVFNATFNNISAVSCQSVLLIKETQVPGENH